MTKRLFIALEFPSEILDAIIEKRNRIVNTNIYRWEPKEKLHLTLKFLGDVESDKINEIESVIEQVIKDNKLSKIELTKFGFFFRNNLPAILWIGIKENNSLSSLVSNLEDKLNKIGFEKEKRKFNPHLTLLRIKNNFPQELIDQFKKGDLNELVFIPFQIKLYESFLKKSGSVYAELKSFNI